MGAVRTAAVLGLAIFGVGCSSSVKPPDLGGLYNRAAQTHDLERNPVIVIPGILGSRLAQNETGQIVWGAFGGGAADPGKPDGARLVAHPLGEGRALAELRDDVSPDGALDRLEISLFGVPVRLDAYKNILGTLGAGGYYDEALGESGAVDYGDDHYTCFQFDYDWRRDNVENAHRLLEFIEEKRAYVQDELRKRYGVENADVRFDIVAHSMGGLLTRYMMRYGDADLPADGSLPPLTWAGAEHLERVLLVGTPSGGSAEAIHNLVGGASFAFFLPSYSPAVLGTMPSIYQLLPRTRHRALRDGDADGPALDLLDPALWVERQWGLASPDQDDVLEMLLPDEPDAETRRRIAIDHQRKCLERAASFHRALDVPADAPRHVDLALFAGDATPTPTVVAAQGAGVRTVTEGPGDGTVSRASALMDERLDGSWTRRLRTPIGWDKVVFLFRDHLGLTKDEAFADNVLYLLLEAPPPVARGEPATLPFEGDAP